MKKVLIIQQVIPEYRIEFFNKLRIELANENIELTLVYGSKSSSFKSGNNFCKINWGELVQNKYFKIGRIELCWQPVIKYLKGKDLVIVEQANKLILNYFIMIAKKFLNNKLGLWGHGRDLHMKSNSLSNKFGFLFLRKCDWWFGYTNGVKDFLIKKNFPSYKITVVQNAIDTLSLKRQLAESSVNDIRELKKQLGIINGKVAIFCGGMYPEKRIDFILESCFLIKKEIPDFQMIFIGSGGESDKVQNASNLNSWIHYVGTKNGQARINYFKIASIQLMPGAVGLGILDSFVLETPIITTITDTHGPEIEYLENEKNGIITKNSLQEYSRTVIEILEKDKYVALIDGCKESANQYTVEKMVGNFKEGIIACLKQK